MLAEKAELHPTYVGQIEGGEVNPSLKTLDKIANVLKVKVPELFPFHIPKTPTTEKEQIIEEILMLLQLFDTKRLTLIKQIMELLKRWE
ncbi:MAG: helix-turn-helix transcriptional regulator [Candidatus Edwardsbacteria bacterium]